MYIPKKEKLCQILTILKVQTCHTIEIHSLRKVRIDIVRKNEVMLINSI